MKLIDKTTCLWFHLNKTCWYRRMFLMYNLLTFGGAGIELHHWFRDCELYSAEQVFYISE